MKTKHSLRWVLTAGCLLGIMAWITPAAGRDLPEIKQSGELRHLGVPYANFVTGKNEGLDRELMQQFARHLGVKYVFVKTDWGTVIPDLIGREVNTGDPNLPTIREVPVKGDVVANGLTILPWRQKLVSFSRPTFPTQVWLITRDDSPLQPVRPSEKLEEDIRRVKSLLNSRTVLCKVKTCLDPALYQLKKEGAQEIVFPGDLNELAPAVIMGEADSTILDVPDALVAMNKWPGKLKIIGPVSAPQLMAVAFPADAPLLQKEFELFFNRIWQDGSYFKLVNHYYPAVFQYYPQFFAAAGEPQMAEKKATEKQ